MSGGENTVNAAKKDIFVSIKTQYSTPLLISNASREIAENILI